MKKTAFIISLVALLLCLVSCSGRNKIYGKYAFDTTNPDNNYILIEKDKVTYSQRYINRLETKDEVIVYEIVEFISDHVIKASSTKTDTFLLIFVEDGILYHLDSQGKKYRVTE